MNLFIKYMVSLRCKMVVMQELKKLGLRYMALDLGIVELRENINKDQLDRLKKNLRKSGLEVLDDDNSIIVEKVKNLIIAMIHHSDELPVINYSEYISENLNLNYVYVSNLFSESTGTTIRQFIIFHKIEKAKELLLYNELNITEIATKLHYSSTAHLCTQFKKMTGLSPSFYKSLKMKRESNLENL